MRNRLKIYSAGDQDARFLKTGASEYDPAHSYEPGNWCYYAASDDDSYVLYQCKTATTGAFDSSCWNDMDSVLALFSSNNTSYDAANINYTATGETATTVKAKIQAIETQVGTAAASLTTALGTATS